MKNSEVAARLKELKELSFLLRIQVNVITKEDFIKISGKLDRGIEKLIDDLKE